MARVRSTINVLAPAARVWQAVADIDKWTLYVPDARKKGWGDRWESRDKPPVAGTEVAMVFGEKLWFQLWQVEACEPPRRLRLASRKVLPVRFRMASSFEVTLSPVTETETKIETTFETRFTGLATPLNWFAPIGRDVELMVTRWEQGVVAALGA